jgi:hypothetical protein
LRVLHCSSLRRPPSWNPTAAVGSAAGGVLSAAMRAVQTDLFAGRRRPGATSSIGALHRWARRDLSVTIDWLRSFRSALEPHGHRGLRSRTHS